MTLPKRIITNLLIFAFILFAFVTPAFANQDSFSSPSNIQPSRNIEEVAEPAPPQTRDATPGASLNTSDARGQVKGIDCLWGGTGIPIVSCIGELAGGVWALVNSATDAFLSYFIDKGSGCENTVTDPVGCRDQMVLQLQQLREGVPYSEIENKGALFATAYVIGQAGDMDNVPISGGQYFASINPFRDAQAAGFDDLSGSGPILKIWRGVRDIAIALSVVVLIIIGFMIMLRVSVAPRTTVTIQNSLPRFAVALLFVVFSFVIAGLMLDFGRVVQGLIGWVLKGGGFADFAAGITSAVLAIILPILFGVFTGQIWLILIGFIMIIIFLILFGIIIYKMISRYAMFFILTVFSPLVFIFAALPKGEGLALLWFKKQIANVLAIPVMVFFIGFAFLVAGSCTLDTNCIPFPYGKEVLGLSFILSKFIALGILIAATKAPEMIDEALGVGSARGAGFSFGGMLTNVSQLQRAGAIKAGREYLGRTIFKGVKERPEIGQPEGRIARAGRTFSGALRVVGGEDPQQEQERLRQTTGGSVGGKSTENQPEAQHRPGPRPANPIRTTDDNPPGEHPGAGTINTLAGRSPRRPQNPIRTNDED